MARFREALWDETDPDYTPLSFWAKQYRYWRPSPKFVDLGADPTPIRLTGVKGDDQGAQRGMEARELTRKLLRKFGEGREVAANTWNSLFDHYEHDRHSPIHDIKPNVRVDYLSYIGRWRSAIGHLRIGSLAYPDMKDMEATMKADGRSAGNIKRHFTILRIVASYGTLIQEPGSKDVRDVLSEMRFSSGTQRRNVAPTRAQALSIIHEADRRDLGGFALGLLLQWWCGLRAVDVRGQWYEVDRGDQGGITRTSTVKRKSGTRTKITRWQDGLTWDMVEPDFSGFTKVVSKTAKSNPEPVWFDLGSLPEIQQRLADLSHRGRTGPVILSGDGLPYTREGWSSAFRRIRRHLKLPEDLRSMDFRAGAITEARDLGASLADMRDMATHASTDTTQRYIRGKDDARGRVLALRKNAI